MTAQIATRHRTWHGARLALWTGLALSLASVVALIVDQTVLQGLAGHVEAQYAPYGRVPDPDVLFTYLYVTLGLGIVVWLVALRGAAKRRAWVPVVAGMTFVVGMVLAVFNLLITEHGTQIFPVSWSIAGLLPSVAGVAAVALLWRGDTTEVHA